MRLAVLTPAPVKTTHRRQRRTSDERVDTSSGREREREGEKKRVISDRQSSAERCATRVATTSRRHAGPVCRRWTHLGQEHVLLVLILAQVDVAAAATGLPLPLLDRSLSLLLLLVLRWRRPDRRRLLGVGRRCVVGAWERLGGRCSARHRRWCTAVGRHLLLQLHLHVDSGDLKHRTTASADCCTCLPLSACRRLSRRPTRAPEDRRQRQRENKRKATVPRQSAHPGRPTTTSRRIQLEADLMGVRISPLVARSVD